MTKLDSPLTALKGVGPALNEKLARLDLHRVGDLLFLLPNRYEDRTSLIKIGSLQPGNRCLVGGEVLLAEIVYRGRRNLLVRIGDGTGQLTLRFFHFSKQQHSQFKSGAKLSCYGDVRMGPVGLEMVHPEYRILKPEQNPVLSDALTPIYPTTEGLQQGRLRNLVGQVLKIAKSSPPEELIADDIRQKYDMPALFDALFYLHEPPPDADLASIEAGQHPYQQRLAFEELLAHYLSLRNLRDIARTAGAPQLDAGAELADRFVNDLPYELTAAQKKVIEEITSDIATPYPMLRLIQGDVGSGKTVVAAVACLKAISSGVQVAVMAPTELLAEQHWRNFSDWFRPLGIEPTGSFRFAPLLPNHARVRGDRLVPIVPIYFPLLSSLGYRALGPAGLYVLPALFSLLTLALMARMGGMLSSDLRERLPEIFNTAYDPATAVPALTARMNEPDFAPPPAPVYRP